MRQGREDKLNRLIERSQNDDLSVSSTSVESITPRSMIDVTFKMQNDDMFGKNGIFPMEFNLNECFFSGCTRLQLQINLIR